MRILVVGAHGFIGRTACRELRGAGHEVEAAGRTDCDVADPGSVGAAVERVQPELIINLAVARDPERYDPVNARGPVTLACEVKKRGIRLIHLASMSEVDPETVPITEASPMTPPSRYGSSKATGTTALLGMAAEGLDVAVLRCSYVYGPGEPASRLIPTVMRCVAADAPIAVTRPAVARDWLHIDDAARAIVAAAERPEVAGLFNVAYGVSTSNHEVVEMIGRIMGRKPRVETKAFPDRPWDSSEHAVEVGLAAKSLNWQAEIDLERGLKGYL